MVCVLLPSGREVVMPNALCSNHRRLTGGQDGPYLANHLHGQGYEVWGTVHPLEDSSLTSIRAPNLHILPTDVADPISLRRTLVKVNPDEIYALAAVSSPAAAESHPVFSLQSSVDSILLLLEWMREVNPKSRLFYASSAAIFGSEPPPQSELTPRVPGSFYGLIKATCHDMVRIYRERYGLYCVNGILFNHESVWRPSSYVTRKITMAAARVAKEGKGELVLGDLSAIRDWGYAGDFARAMCLLLWPDEPRDVVIGTGHGHTIADLLRIAFNLVGKDYRDHVKTESSLMRPSDTLIADPALLSSELDWQTEVFLPELIWHMISADLDRLHGRSEQQIAEAELRGEYLPV